MSWFKKSIDMYEVEDAPFTEEDRDNPFINQTFEEEFVKIPVRQHSSVLPKLQAEVAHGSPDKSTDVSRR